MRSFRNPYHFVPLDSNIPEMIDCPPGEKLVKKNMGHRTFEKYHSETFSGHILCTLETKGPLVVGAKQEKDDDGFTIVSPFERENKPAIPASTLRGCVSAIAEAASNSALRVLDDTFYTRRSEMADALSAIGMIVEENEELRLRPLCMPNLKPNGNREGYTIEPKFRQMFPDVRLKAYCFNKNILAQSPCSYENNEPVYYWAKLNGSYRMAEEGVVLGNQGKISGSGNLLLGLQVTGEVLKTPPVDEGENYFRGFLRVLFKPNREQDMPTKKHEIFIPFPEEMENSPTFPIDENALEDFYKIAKDRETENERRLDKKEEPKYDLLPYCLKGDEDFSKRTQPYCLRHGDIVFFEPDAYGDRVQKVSVSQIWREKFESTTYGFFGSVNKEFLPFHRGREKITPAEAVFGFVEVNEKGESSKAGAKAMASRVRFSDAVVMNEVQSDWYYDEKVPLKILASPKPPCPSFYFRPANLPYPTTADIQPSQCYISKKELDKKKHIPQGRKFYLNHDTGQNIIGKARTKYIEKHQNQKNKVRPIKPDLRFLFRVYFDNLSDYELGMLLYALRPNEDFYHKIGMAKPLGFGSVEINTIGLFLVNRKMRYSCEGFANPMGGITSRYSNCWFRQDIKELIDFGLLTSQEKAAVSSKSIPDEFPYSPSRLKEVFEKNMKPTIAISLKKIGIREIKSIAPPITSDQNDFETETFRWFQNNDDRKKEKKDRQGLVPLEYGEGVRSLKTN